MTTDDSIEIPTGGSTEGVVPGSGSTAVRASRRRRIRSGRCRLRTSIGTGGLATSRLVKKMREVETPLLARTRSPVRVSASHSSRWNKNELRRWSSRSASRIRGAEFRCCSKASPRTPVTTRKRRLQNSRPRSSLLDPPLGRQFASPWRRPGSGVAMPRLQRWWGIVAGPTSQGDCQLRVTCEGSGSRTESTSRYGKRPSTSSGEGSRASE